MSVCFMLCKKPQFCIFFIYLTAPEIEITYAGNKATIKQETA